MKNFKLLLATTAILSTGAILVNAAELGVQINTRVAMFRDFSMEEIQELSFGSIVNPQANQLVVVKPDGTLGAGTTATITGATVTEDGKTVNYTVHSGEITFTGETPQITGILPKADLILPENGIVLKDGTKVCGEVTALTTSDFDQGEAGFYYGGTFKVDENIATSLGNPLFCSATETVTVVLNYNLDD